VIILGERKRRESEPRRDETQMTKKTSTVAINEYAGPATRRRRSARSPAQGKKRERLQAAFLTAFRASCTVTQAAKTAGVGRRTHYDWLTADPSYQTQFEDLEEAVTETLEREAMRRASEGTLKPIFYQGKPCGEIREYSDRHCQVEASSRF
jgi:hypothetical protein